LKESGQAVECTRILVGLLGCFSQLVHQLRCILAIFREMNLVHSSPVLNIPSLAQAVSTLTIQKKTLKCKGSV